MQSVEQLGDTLLIRQRGGNNMKKINPQDNFFFQIIKSIVPQLIYSVFGAVVALIILRTDVTAVTRRVDALERQIIGRDLATEKFDAVNKRIDGLSQMIIGISQKVDRLVERSF